MTLSGGGVEGVTKILGGRFGYFIFFSARGGERGSSRRRGGGGGGQVFIENPRRGGEAGRGRGAGRVSAANWGIFWGGGLIFFSGPKCPPRIIYVGDLPILKRFRWAASHSKFSFELGTGRT